MKHLFSIVIVIGIVGLLVAPGLAEGPRHSSRALFGHGGRVQFVVIDFAHYTNFNVPLWPKCPPDEESCPEFKYIPGLEQLCNVSHVPGPPDPNDPNADPGPGAVLKGDVEGFNVLLSDVFCLNLDPDDPEGPPRSARVEAPGYISGILVDAVEPIPIHMFGRMVLDINPVTFEMQGRWVFDKGFGTHYGVLRVEGGSFLEDGVVVGRGTYTGWIWEQ